tara:strand:+ start:60 stop:569 length:510 start_codon:yes stop_codon:yes gene_type:complete
MGTLSLTSPKLAELIGVDARMPTLWAERGYLHPSLQDAEGRGSKRAWSRENAVHALIVMMFSGQAKGLGSGALRRIAHAVSHNEDLLHPQCLWLIPFFPLPDEGKLILRWHLKDTNRHFETCVSPLEGVPGFFGETSIIEPVSDVPAHISVDIGKLYDHLEHRLTTSAI